MKWIVSLLALAIALAVATPARAELMLTDEPRKDFRWYGVLFLGLSAVSFNVAAHDFRESEKARNKADDSFALYQASTTATDADHYHRQTSHYHRQAVGFESTANAAVVIGIIFGLTGVYSFTNNDRDTPILLSLNRVTLRLRF
jgi:hypothetical protein